MLSLSKLEKNYGEQELFHDVSLQFPERGVVGLVGPNGAGKSTLMRIVMGAESPDAGEVIKSRGLKLAFLGQEVETYNGGKVLETVLAGFADVLNLEHRMEELALQSSAAADNLPQLLAEMSAVQEAFERVDGYSIVERAKTLLHGLGFGDDDIAADMEELSGGWRMRVVLAQLLLQRPDVLLLDEPTNHLDIDAILWLEQFLKTYEGLVILTSHDRAFLDGMCDYICAFEFDTLRLERGNYTQYETALAARMELAEKDVAVKQREKERLERFVERFKAKASKARQAQSRAKQIEKMEIPDIKNPRPPRMHIPLKETPRAPRVIAEFKHVSKRFEDKNIFDDIDWRLERGQKVAVVGPNGAGKTTMLRLLTSDLPTDDGAVERADAVEMAYFAQHHLEALDPDKTLMETMFKDYPESTIGEVRGALGAFLFSGDDVNKKIRVLSGGERARVSLARVFFRPRNLLVLDEPTNHLDMGSIEVLGDVLKKYTGTVVAVSHDRSFLNRFVDHVVDLHPGKFITYPGNMDDYQWHWRQRQAASQSLPPPQAVESKATADKPMAPEKSGGGDDFKARKRVRAEFKKCVRELAAAEAQTANVKETLRDPTLASDHDRLWQAQKDFEAAKKREADLMAEWEKLVDAGTALGLDLLTESA